MEKTLKLWKCNKVTGLYDYQRSVKESEAQAWLKIFREDEPNTIFIVCKNKPQVKER